MRKIIVAMAAVGALLALPTFASATLAHLDQTPANEFSVHGGESELSRVAGGGHTGTTLSGTGKFENTTTGKVTLTLHHVTAAGAFNCTTAGQPTGTLTTTTLPFHLVMLETNKPGILITPGGPSFHFFTSNCGIFVGNIVVRGNGLLGTITSPECQKAGTNAVFLDFRGANGIQEHLSLTQTNYTLESSIGGGPFSQSAFRGEAKITFGFGENRQLLCTH